MPTPILPTFHGQQRWVQVYNGAAEAVPAFGVMRITGIDSDGRITVAKPNTDSQALVLFNGPCEIPIAGEGMASIDLPARVLYDTGDGTPAVASPPEAWGAGNGSWKLRKGKTGVFAWGGASDGSAIFGMARVAEVTFDDALCEITVNYG